MTKDAIINVIDRAFEQAAKLRKQLEQRMPQVRETALRLFEEI
jgi:hypothetical protein